uniref:Uncharacterized protein n=1 Tax=Chenopodium quinoa TaxID=63459 RepID=A0A803M0Q6_CHEQI
MAAKLLHSLADENPDLQKQIGCNSECSNEDLDADSSNAYNRETLFVMSMLNFVHVVGVRPVPHDYYR